MTKITQSGSSYSNLGNAGSTFDLRTQGGGGSVGASGKPESGTATQIANMRAVVNASNTDQLREILGRIEGRAPKQSSLQPIASKGGVPGDSNTKQIDAQKEDTTVGNTYTETSYSARQFYNFQFVDSSDGIFRHRVRCVEKIVMRDKNNQSVSFVFKDRPQ